MIFRNVKENCREKLRSAQDKQGFRVIDYRNRRRGSGNTNSSRRTHFKHTLCTPDLNAFATLPSHSSRRGEKRNGEKPRDSARSVPARRRAPRTTGPTDAARARVCVYIYVHLILTESPVTTVTRPAIVWPGPNGTVSSSKTICNSLTPMTTGESAMRQCGRGAPCDPAVWPASLSRPARARTDGRGRGRDNSRAKAQKAERGCAKVTLPVHPARRERCCCCCCFEANHV